jgi:hypothetical protein
MWLYLAADQGEATSDKTLKEIATSIPPDLQRRARSDAIRQRMILTVSKSKKDKLEAPDPNPKEEETAE